MQLERAASPSSSPFLICVSDRPSTVRTVFTFARRARVTAVSSYGILPLLQSDRGAPAECILKRRPTVSLSSSHP